MKIKEIFSKNSLSRLFRHTSLIIFCLLLLTEIFIAANNWMRPSFADFPCWYVLLPVLLFLAGENAVKLWGVKSLPAQIVCYVLDVVCLLLVTMFSDGVFISLLYIVILSDFYLRQEKLSSNLIMGASCIALFLVTFALSNWIKSGELDLDIMGLVSSMLNDIMLIMLHFVILNFAIQIYRKNKEITGMIEDLNAVNEKLKAANRELQEVTALEERHRIAKDIHDTAGHSITTVIMQTEAARLVIDSDPEDAKRKITAANLQAKHALEELRESVHLLSGTRAGKTLRDLLLEIVHDSSDGTGVTVRYDIDDVELCDAKRRFVLNTLKEGISNGLRHGGATAFWFELKEEGDKVRFLLSDNGTGLEISELKEGFGLAGMHTRAESLGGEVWFDTEPDNGFEIHLTLPKDGNKG